MKCRTHPEALASAVCTRCDQMLCEECVEERGGKTFCGSCADFVDRRAGLRAPVAAAAEAPAADAGGVYTGPDAADFGAGGGGAGVLVAQGAGGGQLVLGQAATADAVQGGSLLLGAVFAVIAGAVGAAVWYGIAVATNYELGLIAIAIGALVGIAAVVGARQGGGAVAAIAVLVTLGAIALGKFLIVRHFLGVGFLTFKLFDFVFYGIGAWQAYEIPMKRSSMAG